MRFLLIRTVSPLLCTQSRLFRFFFSFTLKPSFSSSSSSTSVRFFSSLLSHHRFTVAVFFIRNVFNHLLSFSSLRRFICCSLFHFFYRFILSYIAFVEVLPPFFVFRSDCRVVVVVCLCNKILFYLFLFRNEKLKKKNLGLTGLN